MKVKRSIFLLLMMGVFVLFGCLGQYAVFAYWKDEGAKIEDTDIVLNEDEIDVYSLINQYRVENGLPKLKYSAKLQEVAEIKAYDLLNSGYFSHQSEKYGTTFNIIKDKDINYKVAGENLAGNVTSEKAVEAWINSKSHRENILDEEYNYTAICVIESEVYGKIFVELFIEI